MAATVASMPTAESATPRMPSTMKETTTASTMMTMGTAVLRMPALSPSRMLVAGPVRLLSAMLLTARKSEEVYHSVERPVTIPDTMPVSTATKCM